MKQTCLLCFVGVFLLTAGIPAWSEDAVTAATLKEEILKLMDEGVLKPTIRTHIKQRPLSAPLELDDIMEWKKAGIHERLIQAVLARNVREPLTRTFSMSSKFASLDLTIYPLEFHTAQVEVAEPGGRLQNVTVTVRATNIAKKDHFGIVKVTFLDKDEKAIWNKTKKRSIEKGDANKPIQINFYELTKEMVSSIDKFRLDITVKRD